MEGQNPTAENTTTEITENPMPLLKPHQQRNNSDNVVETDKKTANGRISSASTASKTTAIAFWI